MNTNDISLSCGKPLFDQPLPVGQLYFPSWDRYKTAFRGVFERQYYTNQGPLTQELERKLQEFLKVRNAICVTNATIGLMMTAEALDLTGKIIVPSFTFIASAQSMLWASLEPLFCDIDPNTHQLSTEQVIKHIDKGADAILGVNLWGGSCNPETLTHLAKKNGIQIFFDSAHGFGCEVDGTKLGNFGSAEVFSFHATKIMNTTEGGCICTNDDDLAHRLRNIRSSYGVEKQVDVVKTSNGRMSEAQAAIGLMSLDDFSKNRQNNKTLHRLYESELNGIPGITLLQPTDVSFSNYQYLVCMVDEKEYGVSRDTLINLLKDQNILARRYFYPGLHRTIPFSSMHKNDTDVFPNTDYVCSSCIQFPLGALISDQDVVNICGVVKKVHDHSSKIRSNIKV